MKHKPFVRMALLVTWDVKSLYTNIPHKEGLEALKTTLKNENILQTKIDAILDFSKLVLSCNHFKFLGQNYLQKSGTAMGTKMACSYMNIFMGIFEKQMLLLNLQKHFKLLLTCNGESRHMNLQSHD